MLHGIGNAWEIGKFAISKLGREAIICPDSKFVSQSPALQCGPVGIVLGMICAKPYPLFLQLDFDARPLERQHSHCPEDYPSAGHSVRSL